MRILGNSYIVVAELPVHWLQSASNIPRPQVGAEAAIYPVWLMDGLGTRAHVFMRCPSCDSPMGLGPDSSGEQEGWNRNPPDISLIIGCIRCDGAFMIEQEKAYCLSLTPSQTTRKDITRYAVEKGQEPVVE